MLDKYLLTIINGKFKRKIQVDLQHNKSGDPNVKKAKTTTTNLQLFRD